MKITDLAKLTAKEKRSQLAAFVAEPGTETKHAREVEYLRAATSSSPQLQKKARQMLEEAMKAEKPPEPKETITDEQIAEMGHKRKETAPEPTAQPQPQVPPITVHVHNPPPPQPAPGYGPPSPSDIPSGAIPSMVHFAETLLHLANQAQPPKAEDIANKVVEKVAETTTSSTTSTPAAPTAAPTSTPVNEKKEGPKTMSTQSTQRPGPSGVPVETSQLVRGIGAIILAAGIIGLLVWQFGGAELLNLLLFVVLPVLAVLAALRLVSWGTLQLIWNGALEEKVNMYMQGLRAGQSQATTA
jgi:hypothetical protein